MAASRFSFVHFAIRWLTSVFLVFVTYNPSGYSYLGWVTRTDALLLALLAGVALFAAYLFLLHAILLSIGYSGMAAGLFCAFLLVLEVLRLRPSAESLAWMVEVTLLLSLATILAVGLSWAHVSTRLTGQKQKRYLTKFKKKAR